MANYLMPGEKLRYTTEETVTAATGTHTFVEPGNYTVRLTVADDAVSSLETFREFYVTVLPQGEMAANGDLIGSCGVSAEPGAGAALGALLVLGAGLAVTRRRRRFLHLCRKGGE